jgi:hypothetical protein
VEYAGSSRAYADRVDFRGLNDVTLVERLIGTSVRPADGARIEQSQPDFSWPDLNPTLNDRITLTLRVMLPRILAGRFLD